MELPNKQLSNESTQVSLSHSVQTKNKRLDFFSPISQFLDNVGDIPKIYDSFELAEKAIRALGNVSGARDVRAI